MNDGEMEMRWCWRWNRYYRNINDEVGYWWDWTVTNGRWCEVRLEKTSWRKKMPENYSNEMTMMSTAGRTVVNKAYTKTKWGERNRPIHRKKTRWWKIEGCFVWKQRKALFCSYRALKSLNFGTNFPQDAESWELSETTIRVWWNK